MRKQAAWGLASLLLLATAQPAVAEPVTAKVDTGTLTGSSDGGVNAFKGVPFAAPPVGPLRWQPPQPAAAWQGARPALDAGPACVQPLRPGGRNGGGVAGAVSEDCLTLNVFAPAHARKAPVMVWIYGGSNTMGAKSLPSYDGSAFARDGVVMVAANYRLGALGFFAHPALTAAAKAGEPLANYALMDQIAALQWVRRNIAAFGGDPANVTVFGESAGGINIVSLMSVPSARGLFAKAIIESGAGWTKPVPLAAAESAGQALADKVAGPGATLDKLRAVPAEAVVAAQGGAGAVVDGRLLTESPTEAFARGHAAPVPLIIGTNTFEASLLAAFRIAPEDYLARQPAALQPAYANLPTAKDKAYAMFTDGLMGAPARWIAAGQSARAPTWLYEFSYVRPELRATQPGAGHAMEIVYVFDSWDHLGDMLPTPAGPEEKALTGVMHACWVAFAKTGKPTCPTPQPWPAYTPARDQLMEFGAPAGVRTHYRKAQLDAQQAAQADLLSGR